MKITTILLTFTLLSGATTAIGQETMMPAPKQQETADVSDKELEKFAVIYKKVQAESEKMQKKAVEAIKAGGIEVERFNEIASAKQNPDKEVETNEKETEQLTNINTKIQEIQTKFQGQVAEMIKQNGLTIQRYQEIYNVIQQDQELQKRFGELING
jgi:hypothetical protein